jgi:hypothetical protein
MINKPRNLKGELLATEPWVEQKIAAATAGVASIAGKSGNITIDSNFTMSEQGQLGLAQSISVNNITYNGNAANAEGGLVVLGEGKKLDSDIKVVHSIAEATGDLTLGSNLKLSGGSQIDLADVVTLAAEMDKGITFSMADGMVSNGKDITLTSAKLKVGTGSNIQVGEDDLFNDEGQIDNRFIPASPEYSSGRFIEVKNQGGGLITVNVEGAIEGNTETFNLDKKTVFVYGKHSVAIDSDSIVIGNENNEESTAVNVSILEDMAGFTAVSEAGTFGLGLTVDGKIFYNGKFANTAGGVAVVDSETGKLPESILPELGKTYTAGKFIDISEDGEIAVKGAIEEQSGTTYETFEFDHSTEFASPKVGGAQSYMMVDPQGAILGNIKEATDKSHGRFWVSYSDGSVNLDYMHFPDLTGSYDVRQTLTVKKEGLFWNGKAVNTAGGLLVLDSNGNVPVGAVTSFAGKQGAITVSNDFTMSEAGQLGVLSGTFLRLTNANQQDVHSTVRFYDKVSFGEAGFSSTVDFGWEVSFNDDVNVNTGQLTLSGNYPNTAGGIVTLDSNGKLREEQLPPLAITKVLPVEADGSDLLTLLKKAATDAGLTQVENSELVMIYRPEGEESNSSSTSLSDDYYDSVCGEYFVLNEVTVANMQLTDVKKTYSRSSINITVNGKTPVDGNITINLADLADVTAEQARVLKTIKTGGSGENLTVEVDGIGLVTKKDLQDSQELAPVCMKFSVPLTGTLSYEDNTVNVTRTVEGTNYKFTFTTQIPVADPVGVVLELIRATLIDSTNSTRTNVILDTTSSYDGESGLTTLVVEADFGDGYVATDKSFDFVILVGKCLTIDASGAGGSGGTDTP